jgi:uncharacterized OB-fold protein
MDELEPVLPVLTEANRGFWDAARAGTLAMQRCGPCGHIRYPISPICPRCLSPEFAWTPLSGRGTVLSFVIFDRAYNPAWASRVPYNVALVQLAEGPRMFSNIVGVPNERLTVGLPVQVTFEGVPDAGISIPRFAPAG